MKMLSTFGEVDNTEIFYVKGITCWLASGSGDQIRAEDTRGGFYFKEIPPGESFTLELDMELGYQDPDKIVVNWICNATKKRGIFFYNRETDKFSSFIDGLGIRESLSLAPQLLDDLGRIISTGEKSTLWLEGRQSYFPTVSIAEKPPFAHAFVHLDVDLSAGQESIFSKDTVQAVYNINSLFINSETGSPNDNISKFFSLYEVWRQLIEVVLNNDDINDFQNDKWGDETRVVSVVSNVLSEIFPKRSFQEIKKLRLDDYPSFCRHIQSYFFERCKE